MPVMWASTGSAAVRPVTGSVAVERAGGGEIELDPVDPRVREALGVLREGVVHLVGLIVLDRGQVHSLGVFAT
jgi:hypothetical protein